MSKVGLVLEGGGTRAIYTSGVLDVFIKNKIKFPYVIGVSAGSCNGTSYLGGNYRRQHDLTVDYVNDKRYMGIQHMLKNGMFLNLPWIFGELSYDINPLDHDTFENSGSQLVAVVTNAETAQAEYVTSNNFREGCDILAASCAMPLATKGVEIDGNRYFDGGVADSIPVAYALKDGCDKAVVVLTQHKGYVKRPPKGIEVIKKALRQYPKLAEALANRHIMYNGQLELVRELEQEGRIIVIQPQEPLNAGTLERRTDKLEEIYKRGFDDGINALSKVQEFLL